MKKILPVNTKTFINSECWTFFRTAIIDTSDSGRDWICTHYNLCMNRHRQIMFGDKEYHYTFDHYSSILDYDEIELNNTADIIKTMREGILNEEYFLLNCNSEYLLTGQYAPLDPKSIHEYLFYGFDDEKQTFQYLSIRGRKGVVESEIAYDTLGIIYKEMLIYYCQNPGERFSFATWNNYPITKIKLKPYRTRDSAFIYQVLHRLRVYLDGAVVYNNFYDSNGNVTSVNQYKNYIGLGCFIGLIELIEDRLESGECNNITRYPINILLSIKKLCEHRKIFIEALNRLAAKLKCKTNDIDILLQAYKQTSVNIDVCFADIIKYDQTENIELLKGIKEKLLEVYREEQNLLDRLNAFIHHCLCIQYQTFGIYD